MSLIFVGDVHGNFEKYISLVSPFRHSVCVGDVGFNYDKLSVLHHYSHKIIGGNHDNWTSNEKETDYHKKYYKQTYHFLGDYGLHTIPEYGKFFFVRGAWSIDQKYRTWDIDWWREEELDRETAEKALDFYKDIKPEYMITHECPFSITYHLDLDPDFARSMGHHSSYIRTKTNQLLQAMLDFHKPKLWIFGHFHQYFHRNIEGTKFICLPELGPLTFTDQQDFAHFLNKEPAF